jgi:hypothetical protein
MANPIRNNTDVSFKTYKTIEPQRRKGHKGFYLYSLCIPSMKSVLMNVIFHSYIQKSPHSKESSSFLNEG